ncbi:hypothetical protein J2Z49_002185 [Desulfofundulus luciae]|uniref:Uncharacterized protein n=1 Tax=Desulfofundulus luciae TaxID=74702 RepID=A0ABU0B2X2_9FIRM|nr:hypothetical protein [Desulfofundulus luciae]
MYNGSGDCCRQYKKAAGSRRRRRLAPVP